MLYNAIIAALRTGVATLVGLAITWLVSVGVTLPDGAEVQLNAILFVVITAGYTALVNWLSVKVHPAFGYLLGVPKTPEYNAVAAERRSDGQVVATANSPLPTGEIVTVQEVPEYDAERLGVDPHPYLDEE